MATSSRDSTVRTDVAIVGGGPIGLELAAALRHHGTECLVIEAGAIGSTIAWWAPFTRFFSSPERITIAGVPFASPDQSKVTREEYLAYLRAVARQFDLPVRAHSRVTRIEGNGDGFTLLTRASMRGVGGAAESSGAAWAVDAAAAEQRVHARHVVLAIGNMHRARRIGIPGEALPHVSHYLGDVHDLFGARVVIVGGKNSAVEAALRCYRAGIDVVISYRGDSFPKRSVKYWLLPEIEWLIDKGRIGWHPRTMPVEIGADRVTLAPTATGAEGRGCTTLPADRVLLLTGYVQDAALFEQLDLPLEGDEGRPVHDPETMETPRAGIFVAGTAIGGSQARTRIFLENSHVHVERITRRLTGAAPPWPCGDVYSTLVES